MSNPLMLLLRSRKFWLSVVAVVQTTIFVLVPNFPEQLWQAIDGLIVILIAAITVEDAAAKIASKP